MAIGVRRVDAAPGHHVFLIGFMAAGKTTVGRLVAERLGLPFVDLDEYIERAAGISVREIFATRGEAGFRRLESEALTRVCGHAPSVIATGGGAPCHADIDAGIDAVVSIDNNNRDTMNRMRAHGLVIELGVSLETVRARVRDPASRPLFGQPGDQVRALYQARQSCYRRAHAAVTTDARSPERVADIVVQVTETADAVPRDLLDHTCVLGLPERSYPIIVSPGVLDRLGALARVALGERCSRIALVSDDHVAPLYAERAERSLRQAGFRPARFVVPAGESSKSFEQVAGLARDMVAAGLDRRSAIIALGGGVIGDLAGFVAAILFRGIPCIQVPTSALAMIDAAIGGKTGIDLASGKNLVGAFWQPRAVVADPRVLATLPARDRRATFGELVKYGLLVGPTLYEAIERTSPSLFPAPDSANADADIAALSELIRRCATEKSRIVGRDERDERGERALLNLGHTIGHAIEAAAGYDTLRHGEAVALGLLAACRVSVALGLCAAEVEARVLATLERVGLDTGLRPWMRDDVLARVRVDKKRSAAESLDFVAVRAIGECAIVALPVRELSRILRP